jgi:hypothetical protein
VSWHVERPLRVVRRPGRQELLRVIGELQQLTGEARSVYSNDRDPSRADKLDPLLARAFDLCVEALGFDGPLAPKEGGALRRGDSR